jgi:amidohydrolase
LTLLDELKGKVIEAVEEQRDRLYEISAYIYENPELGSEEFKAAEFLTGELEKQGFTVKRGILGMPTAFSATYKGKGSGPKVAVIAEYDCLPGVGHGCGHNLIAASAVGAGVAASRVMSELDGEVLVVGTPAEEGHGPSAGAKVVMVKNGFWDDIDAAVMLHPASHYVAGSRALGISKVLMEFEGQTSHAAASPHEGVNALNAATLAFMATHMLRQEARRDANLVIHGVITEGGLASNIIPDRAVCDFGVRSSDDRGKKVNEPLAEVLWNNYAAQGVEVKPLQETLNGMPMASTDFGDVSQKIPAASSSIAVTEPGTPGHSVQMADATMTEKGQKAMIVGTKALATTLVELLAEPEKLKIVKEHFNSH